MKKIKVSKGDLIKAPISTDEFIVCRVISEEKFSAYLVEFFKTKLPSSTKTIDLGMVCKTPSQGAGLA